MALQIWKSKKKKKKWLQNTKNNNSPNENKQLAL